jgi:hypothetical protein
VKNAGTFDLFGNSQECVTYVECPGCAKRRYIKNASKHTGRYTKIMDWGAKNGTGDPIRFADIVSAGDLNV